MIYTELTNKALRIAYDAHAGQLDKCGAPYIAHPLHVAEQMDDEASTCVALLHDVVEDSDVTLDGLACDFPPAAVEGVRLAHHSNETRFAGRPVAPEELERRRRKYAAARAILLEE